MRRLTLLLLPMAVIAAAFAPARATVKFTDVRFQMSDDVMIAADVYLPEPGVDGHTQYPCVVEHTPYRKEMRATEGVSLLPGEGIAVIEVDARGTGGSAGEYDFVFSLREQYDAAEIIEKVATTDFLGVGYNVCLPQVGMYGGSYSGIIQYLVATLPAPHYPAHLAAIAPQRAYGDLYRDIVYHGGVVIGSFGLVWSGGTTAFYTQPPGDIQTAAGQAAWLDHLTRNDPMMLHYLANPTIDATDTTSGITQKLYEDSSPLPRIENLKVPALHLAGWLDAFTRGQLLTFKAALANERPEAPNYLVIGPWNHSNTHFITPEPRPGLKQMLAGWYKHWLAGGPAPSFLAGPRVQYYVMGPGVPYKLVDPRPIPDPTGEWQSAPTWPVPGMTYQKRYLRAGGALSTTAATGAEADASYVYNPLAGTADAVGRWDNAASGSVPHPYWDQQTEEPKGLSYTTEVLARDTRVVGPINLHLNATTTGLPGAQPAPWPGLAQLVPPYHDTDFIVKLADVAPDGTSTIVTQGYLRASHRDVDLAGSDCVPVSCADGGDVVRPLHFDDAAHVSPPGAGAQSYEIEIWPTAKIFVQGHRLRLAIYSADTPSHLTLLKPAMNTVHHSFGGSWLMLPLMPA